MSLVKHARLSSSVLDASRASNRHNVLSQSHNKRRPSQRHKVTEVSRGFSFHCHTNLFQPPNTHPKCPAKRLTSKYRIAAALRPWFSLLECIQFDSHCASLDRLIETGRRNPRSQRRMPRARLVEKARRIQQRRRARRLARRLRSNRVIE